MTISNSYVREYLHLYHELRNAVTLSDLFFVYGQIKYTLASLKKDNLVALKKNEISDSAFDRLFALEDRFFDLSCSASEKFGSLV